MYSRQEITGSKNNFVTEVKNKAVIRATSSPTERGNVTYIFRSITEHDAKQKKAHCMKKT